MPPQVVIIKEHVIIDHDGRYRKDYEWGDWALMPNGCHRAEVTSDELVLLKNGRTKAVGEEVVTTEQDD